MPVRGGDCGRRPRFLLCCLIDVFAILCLGSCNFGASLRDATHPLLAVISNINGLSVVRSSCKAHAKHPQPLAPLGCSLGVASPPSAQRPCKHTNSISLHFLRVRFMLILPQRLFYCVFLPAAPHISQQDLPAIVPELRFVAFCLCKQRTSLVEIVSSSVSPPKLLLIRRCTCSRRVESFFVLSASLPSLRTMKKCVQCLHTPFPMSFSAASYAVHDLGQQRTTLARTLLVHFTMVGTPANCGNSGLGNFCIENERSLACARRFPMFKKTSSAPTTTHGTSRTSAVVLRVWCSPTPRSLCCSLAVATHDGRHQVFRLLAHKVSPRRTQIIEVRHVDR